MNSTDPTDVDAPPVPRPPFSAQMQPLCVYGSTAYLSGIGPVGERGTVGLDLSVADGINLARTTAQYAARRIIDEFGTLDVVDRWLSVRGYVRSTADFADQPTVLNGFSDEIIRIFGRERGLCARSAVGVVSLPAGMPVEVEAIIALTPAVRGAR